MIRSKVSRSALQQKKNNSGDVGYSTWAWMSATLLLIAGVVALCVLLLYKPFFQLSRIQVHGTHVLHGYDIAREVQEMAYQKTLWVVPRDSWVTLPKKKIQQHLFQTFDRIQDIDIDVRGFDRLLVHITEWQPSFLWCNLDTENDTYQDCWFMDVNGTIFSKAPYFSPGVYPMFVTERNALDEVLGQKKIDPEILQQVLALYQMLEKDSHSIETITFGQQQDIVFTLATLDDIVVDSPELLVTRNMDMETLQQNLKLLLGHTTFLEKFREVPEDLLYVDLRFDGKLLFRFR